MDSNLNDNIGYVKKCTSEKLLKRWRDFNGLVKNRKRSFRSPANLQRRGILQLENLFHKVHRGQNLSNEYTVPKEVETAGFQICPDELGSIVEDRDIKKFKFHGGVKGISEKLSTSITSGISTSKHLLNRRIQIYGTNKSKGFRVFVWEALHNITLMIVAVYALISLVFGLMVEGWPKGAADGLGIVSSILLVLFFTATSDYKQSLQFKDLDKDKQIKVKVTRDRFRQSILKSDLLPGDIVHLSPRDQVPADGLFASRHSVLINKSSLTGKSEPLDSVNAQNPFLLSGTKLQHWSCKMLVTTVGIRTQWGKRMATLSERTDELNGVATILGKIGIYAAVVIAVLVQRLIVHMLLVGGTYWTSSRDDVAIRFVVIAVREGLVIDMMKPLAARLALSIKKMMHGDTRRSAAISYSNKNGSNGKIKEAGCNSTGVEFVKGIGKKPEILGMKEKQMPTPEAASSESRKPCYSKNSDYLIRELILDLISHKIDKQKQAAQIIRAMASNKSEDRIKIAKAGAIGPLISLISSSDHQLQEDAVTAILKLSLCDKNRELIASSGAIEPLARALKTGTSTAKENAACALLQLSQTEENKIVIGRSGAISLLVELLENGSFEGKKDALKALISVCSINENKSWAVEVGIINPLLKLMADSRSNLVEKSAFFMFSLVSLTVAKTALVKEGGIPLLVRVIAMGSREQQEMAVAILLQVCKNKPDYLFMVAKEGAAPHLEDLSKSGTRGARKKAKILRQRLQPLIEVLNV